MKGKLVIVYGGQFGSEGKGQIAAHIAAEESFDYAVRVGGPNAGHTFIVPGTGGKKQVCQSVPIAAMFDGANPHTIGVIGAGGLILLDVLIKEMKDGMAYKNRPVHLLIDPCAAVISAEHMEREAALKDRIGSTGEGVGACTADKVMRIPGAIFGSVENTPFRCSLLDRPEFGKTYASRTVEILNDALMQGDHVMIEGTQGVGLSLHTSGYYPFCTSRECTPQGLLAETGISPDNAERVERVMVVRTYPIRVGGNSGPLPFEMTWEQLSKDTNGYIKVPEITTVTKKPRRIARIDWYNLDQATLITRPTAIALTFFDYWFPEVANCERWSDLGSQQKARIDEVEQAMGTPVAYVSTGLGHVINMEE